ncbi:MAG: hypothetical protein K1X64_17800 [Myxococcaceae bacterium]|nr:hypothetical protein [Myxococcaceae bacterium]
MKHKIISVLATSTLLLFLGCPGPGPSTDGGTGGGAGGGTAAGGGQGTGGGSSATGGGQGTGGGVATGGGQGTGGGQHGTGGGSATGGGQGTGGGTGGEINPDAGPGSGTLTGDLAFPVAKARSLFFLHADGGFDRSLIQVGMIDVDLPNLCGSSAPTIPVQGVSISVGTGTNGGDLAPGTYPLTMSSAFSPTGGANVLRLNLDNGMPTMTTVSATGSVTFNSISPTAVTGSFDAVLELPNDGGFSPLSGTFDAPGCIIGE